MGKSEKARAGRRGCQTGAVVRKGLSPKQGGKGEPNLSFPWLVGQSRQGACWCRGISLLGQRKTSKGEESIWGREKLEKNHTMSFVHWFSQAQIPIEVLLSFSDRAKELFDESRKNAETVTTLCCLYHLNKRNVLCKIVIDYTIFFPLCRRTTDFILLFS